MKYRNIGAPFRRADGTVWGTDSVEEPTPDELRRRRYKLRAVGEEHPEMFGWERDVVETPPPDLPGWPLRMTPETYLKMHSGGKHEALALELVGEKQQSPVAEEGEGPTDESVGGEEVTEADGSDDGD